MKFSVQRRPGTGAFASVPGIFLLLLTTGCYTRQIEGIQSDLDNLDRKIYSFRSKTTKGNSSVPTGAVTKYEDDLNLVRMQQTDMSNEIGHLRQQLTETTKEAKLLGPGPSGARSLAPGDLGTIRKELVKNHEQTDRLSREMEDLQKTFGILKTETRALIDLLQSEYGTETGASSDTISSVPPPSSTRIEAPGETAFGSHSDVKVARTHRVNPGETLTSISRKYNVSMETLKEINGIDDPDNLLLNQEVYIP